jgi:hypothetical protein
MSKQQQRIFTIGTMVVIAITIFPLIQVMLLTLNGGLIYVLALPFGAETRPGVMPVTSIVVNSVLAISGLLTFYFAEQVWLRMLSVFQIMFSAQMLTLFVSDGFDEGDHYWQGWLIVAGIPVLIILIAALLRYSMTRRGNASSE